MLWGLDEIVKLESSKQAEKRAKRAVWLSTGGGRELLRKQGVGGNFEQQCEKVRAKKRFSSPPSFAVSLSTVSGIQSASV